MPRRNHRPKRSTRRHEVVEPEQPRTGPVVRHFTIEQVLRGCDPDRRGRGR